MAPCTICNKDLDKRVHATACLVCELVSLKARNNGRMITPEEFEISCGSVSGYLLWCLLSR